MKHTCNIDAKGKAVRLIWGILCLVAGALAIFLWAIPTGGWLSWTVSIACVAFGAFGIYEARAGWCAVRAMGFKTPV